MQTLISVDHLVFLSTMMIGTNIGPLVLNVKTQTYQFLSRWMDPQLYLKLEPRPKMRSKIMMMTVILTDSNTWDSVSLATPCKVSATSNTSAVRKIKQE